MKGFGDRFSTRVFRHGFLSFFLFRLTCSAIALKLKNERVTFPSLEMQEKAVSHSKRKKLEQLQRKKIL